ncbi:MAG TPA: winged helix-turn-helix domain-containing protein [Nitrososphaeraceae archaeon]|nr:winged helix-turn-helix domain-containing protein [Nitrososphaeraceae archaeon]
MSTKVYRGRNEIIAQMLQVIKDTGSEGVSRTSIMYKSYLSHAQLKEYLSLLVEKSLIVELPHQIRSSGNEKFVYKTTEKGLRFLHICREIEDLIGLK